MTIVDFKKRVYKEANLKTSCISIILIFCILIVMSLFLILSDHNSLGFIFYSMILLFLILFVGVWKQSYYLFLYNIKESDRVIELNIEPTNMKLKAHFNSGFFNKFASDYFGVIIEFQINSHKKRIIYPFHNNSLSLSPSIRYKAIQDINRELSKIKHLEVSYLNNSGVITESTANIDKIVHKIKKSYQ